MNLKSCLTLISSPSTIYRGKKNGYHEIVYSVPLLNISSVWFSRCVHIISDDSIHSRNGNKTNK